MITKYEQFMESFNLLEKDKCINMVFKWLIEEEISIETLYEDILITALSNLSDVETDPNHRIWFEHVQSSIIRTIIEMAHPFVLKQKGSKSLGLKGAVICPDGEQHELGARMINDYLTKHGITSYFVGRDTPKSEFNDMIVSLDLDVVAISVTNYYNLSEVRKTIELIRAQTKDVKIILGGRAIIQNPQLYEQYENTIIFTNSQQLLNWLQGGAK